MFKQRLLSGIVLVILAVLVLIPGGYVLGGACVALSFIAYKELMKAFGNAKEGKNITSIEALGYIDIVFYYVVLFFMKDGIWPFLALFLILVTFMGLYVFSYPKYEAKDIVSGYFSIIYAPCMLGFMYMIRNLEYGQYLIWLVFICSWVSDTFAYVTGMLFGRSGKHKLAPVLSPKKSVEGAVGAIVITALVSGGFAYFCLDKLIPDVAIFPIFIVLGALGSVISQIGDLAASAIKRNTGIKDYGKLIPGHGGIMDRFDSVIFVSPGVYIMSLIFITFIC